MRLRHRPFRPQFPRTPGRDSLRRGIYIIPSLFTVGNMLCGFAAILYTLHSRLEMAGWLILLAGVLDGLDGRIARLTGTTSEFGKEYDSLADVVSFGVAPAIIIYQWGLWTMGRWGWAVAFLFVVAGSVRLARYNVRSHVGGRRYFVGLPIPAGAGALTLLVLVDPAPLVDRWAGAALWSFVLLISFLMVCQIPYRSFKDFNLRQRWPATAFFLIALIVAFIAVSPVPAMAAFLTAFLLSGPAEYLVRKVRGIPYPEAVLENDSVRLAPLDPEHP